MEQLIKEYMQGLVAIDSVYPSSSCQDICNYIAGCLSNTELKVNVYQPTVGKFNVYATLGEGRPHVVLNAHIDTIAPGVEWSKSPFNVTEDGDDRYGLGISNCKGLAAMHMALAQKLARDAHKINGKVTFTFVCDEENLGQDGLASLRSNVLGPVDSLLVAAPSENKLITQERGIMWMKLQAFGQAAHAGKPELGDSAVLRMARIVSKIESDYIPKLLQHSQDGMASTINMSKLTGGQNTNVVPDNCTLEIDRRFPSTWTVAQAYQHLYSFIQSLGEPEGSWSLTTLLGTEAYQSRSDGALALALGSAIEVVTGESPEFTDAVGAFDGRYFASDGIEIITFGSGDGDQGHSDDEKISWSQLLISAEIHHAALLEYLNTGDAR